MDDGADLITQCNIQLKNIFSNYQYVWQHHNIFATINICKIETSQQQLLQSVQKIFMKNFSFLIISLLLVASYSSIVSINRCVAGSYWNTANSACQTCASVTNSNGASRQQNSCGCLATFKWVKSTQTCDVCTSNCRSSSQNYGYCAVGSYFSPSKKSCITCSSVADSTGVSSQNSCVCQDTYYWNSKTQACTPCPSTGCPVIPQREKCPSSYYLNKVSKLCFLCSSDALSTGASSQNGCLCQTGNYWSQNTQSCVACSNGVCPNPPGRDGNCLDGSYYNTAAQGCLQCVSDLNSNGASTGQKSCGCLASFYWDKLTQKCSVCTGTCPSSTNNGKCASGSYFNVAGSQCSKCSSVSNSNGASTNQNSCGCLDTFYWVRSTQTCDSCQATGCPTAPVRGKCASGSYINRAAGGCLVCPSDSTSTGASGNDNSCICATGFFWNFNTQACEACAVSGCPAPVQNQRCSTGFYIDNASRGCLSCSTVDQSTTVSNQKGCVCNINYYWDQRTDTCLQCPNGVCPKRKDDDD